MGFAEVLVLFCHAKNVVFLLKEFQNNVADKFSLALPQTRSLVKDQMFPLQIWFPFCRHAVIPWY